MVVHGIGLSLGGSERPDPARLRRLAAVAEAVSAPLVSEHVAFGRAHRDGLSEDARVELLRARCARRCLVVLVDRAAGGRAARAACPWPGHRHPARPALSPAGSAGTGPAGLGAPIRRW
ncbi:DUF692 domain-containing protein [Frankia tisae]|uniref:DUF692 domain-containing protein n=1 Tax=Frankia tisae TaxID=2950104 RepID=UPI0021BF6ED5|nr:DUF692 domain-containing protein [Frankia tisae]